MYNINKLQSSLREYPINYTFKSFKKGRKKNSKPYKRRKINGRITSHKYVEYDLPDYRIEVLNRSTIFRTLVYEHL